MEWIAAAVGVLILVVVLLAGIVGFVGGKIMAAIDNLKTNVAALSAAEAALELRLAGEPSNTDVQAAADAVAGVTGKLDAIAPTPAPGPTPIA